jgi:hypothetical protein
VVGLEQVAAVVAHPEVVDTAPVAEEEHRTEVDLAEADTKKVAGSNLQEARSTELDPSSEGVSRYE